jgi:hypothetical protein
MWPPSVVPFGLKCAGPAGDYKGIMRIAGFSDNGEARIVDEDGRLVDALDWDRLLG